MRAEEGGGDGDGAPRAQSAGGAQLAGFGVRFQAVAGLDLDGGDAFGEQGVEARQGLRDQLVLGCGAGRLHGGEDAAAGTRDLLVGGAAEAQLELVRAVAAVDEVGVAVDQAGRDPAAFEIDALGGFKRGLLGLRTDPGNAAILGGDGTAFDAADAAARGIERGDARIRPETVNFHGASSSSPSPRGRGEGRGEGQPRTPALEQAAAPHPNPLPMKYGERECGGPHVLSPILK